MPATGISIKTFIFASSKASVGCCHMSRQRNGFCVKSYHAERKLGNYIKNCILGVFILNISILMGRRSIILVASFFTPQNASNDTHEDTNGSTSRFDPDHG